MKRVLLSCLLLCIANVAHAEGVDITSVLAKFAKLEALSAKFHEEKRMVLLSAPILSDGMLHYQKPRMLVKHTSTPRVNTVLLRGDTLSFGDEKHVEKVELAKNPVLQVFVGSFISLLSGDLAGLEEIAELSVEGTEGGGFRLKMVPKSEKVKSLVQTMTFEGKGAMLKSLVVVDGNGDLSTTTFTDVKLRKAFSAAEQARVFRAGP